MGKLKKIAKIILGMDKYDYNKGAREESMALRSLKSQLRVVTELNEQNLKLIREQAALLSERENENIQSEIIKLIAGFFGNKQDSEQTKLNNISQLGGSGLVTNLESGIQYTDKEIEKFLDSLPKKYLKRINWLSRGQMAQTIKGYIPNVSEESIDRFIELGKKRINEK